jgi:flagellin-like hook-associated protein FlgL
MVGGPVISGVVFINGFASADITTVYNNSQATRSNVVHAINLISDRTGVKAIDTGSDVKGISLVAVDGRNIEVRFETAASTHSNVFGQRIGMREGVQSATISLESNIETSIVLSSDPLGDISRSGLVDGDFSKNESVQMTSQRTHVKPSIKQIEAVHFSGPLPSEGDIFGVTINGVGFTYRANASDGLSFQSLRNNLINQINAQGGLNVTAVKGQNTSEIHLVSDTPGVSFSLSMQSRSEVMMSSSTLVENHRADTRSLGMDDLIINGVKVPPTNARSDKVSTYRSSSSEPSASAIAIADSINSVKQITGVSAFPNGAEISGQYTDTSLPSAVANSLYSLFINGIEVKIPFSPNESVSQRLSNVVAAINMREGQHGVVASSNGKGVDLLSDGRNISVWYDSNVKDLSPACFGLEQGGSVSQISQITITGPSDVPSVVQTPTYLEFSDFGTVTEQLGISVDGSPSSANGVFSFFNGVLYKGDGVRANGIGRIDATNNGVNGSPLRINLSNIFELNNQFFNPQNGHYYEVVEDPAGITWTDARAAALNKSLFGLTGYLATVINQDEQSFINTQLANKEGWVGASDLGVEGSWKWMDGPEAGTTFWIGLQNGNTQPGQYSNWDAGEPNNSLAAFGGAGEDFAYIRTNGKWNDYPDQQWPADWWAQPQSYVVEYGGIGTLTQPTISAQELQALKSKITYSDSASNQNTVSVTINGVTVTSSQTTRSALALASSLEQAIQEKISDGLLNNISVERLDDKITIKSTVAGAGFDIYGADSTSSDNSLSIQEAQSNDQGNNLVTAVHSANVNSEGAATAYGTVSLVAQPTQLSSLLNADGIATQSGGLSGKAIQISCGANGFGAESNFKALGFREGTFGGMASADLQPPRIGRMAFQIGSDSGQHITIDLPDFGSKGGITGEITNDVAMEVENRSIRITTREGAVTVLGLLDSVMDKVNSNRANYGAVINRLEHVINNLSSGSVNMTASRSQIQDADYAASSTEMAKTTIMQQSATAVLAQANASNQNVLKLLES